MKRTQSTPRINIAVMDAMGIDYKNQNIVSIKIELQTDKLPQLTIERVLLSVPEPRYTFETREIHGMRPLDKDAPFDLDAMCKAATRRVGIAINKLTAKTKRDVQKDFFAARARLGLRKDTLEATPLPWRTWEEMEACQ